MPLALLSLMEVSCVAMNNCLFENHEWVRSPVHRSSQNKQGCCGTVSLRKRWTSFDALGPENDRLIDMCQTRLPVSPSFPPSPPIQVSSSHYGPTPTTALDLTTYLLPTAGPQLNSSEVKRIRGRLKKGVLSLESELFGACRVLLLVDPGGWCCVCVCDVCMHVRMFACLYVCMFVCLHVCMFIWQCARMHVCVLVYSILCIQSQCALSRRAPMREGES